MSFLSGLTGGSSKKRSTSESWSKSPWGSQYPSWLTDLLKRQTGEGYDYAADLERIYKEGGKAFSSEADMSQFDEALRGYIASLEQGGTEEGYRDIAKNAWNKSFAALSEIPGMTEGQRLTAIATMQSEYGNALTQAGILGEQERISRATSIFGAKEDINKARLTERQRMIQALQEYAKLGVQIPGVQQNLTMAPVQAAINLPIRSTHQYNQGKVYGDETSTSLGALVGQLGGTALGYYLGKTPTVG